MLSEIPKVSAQKAIANYCKGCIYDPLAGGTWREQVENCTIPRCELYAYRPRAKRVREAEREAWLNSLTTEQRIAEGLKSKARAENLRLIRESRTK